MGVRRPCRGTRSPGSSCSAVRLITGAARISSYTAIHTGAAAPPGLAAFLATRFAAQRLAAIPPDARCTTTGKPEARRVKITGAFVAHSTASAPTSWMALQLPRATPNPSKIGDRADPARCWNPTHDFGHIGTYTCPDRDRGRGGAIPAISRGPAGPECSSGYGGDPARRGSWNNDG